MVNFRYKQTFIQLQKVICFAAFRKLDDLFIDFGLVFIERLDECVVDVELDIGLRMKSAEEISRQLSCPTKYSTDSIGKNCNA